MGGRDAHPRILQSAVLAELVGQFGSLDSVEDQGITGSHDIRKFGGAARVTWKGVEGKLRLGLESGFATGDQWDNTVQGRTNIAYANLLGDPNICNAQNQCTLSQFMLDRDYKVDMILWRHLVGAVTNAGFVKPSLQYDLTKSIMFKVANITSFALKPVATPGNSTMYGTEFNGDLGYNSGGLFAGISLDGDPPATRIATHDHRKPFESRVIVLFHRGIEGVHVDMDDVSGHGAAGSGSPKVLRAISAGRCLARNSKLEFRFSFNFLMMRGGSEKGVPL